MTDTGADTDTAPMASLGVMISRTGRPPNSSTPERRSAANPGMAPSSREAATTTASSSAVRALASSLFGSTPSIRTPRLPSALSNRTNGPANSR